jgi:hypothetical protein
MAAEVQMENVANLGKPFMIMAIKKVMMLSRPKNDVTICANTLFRGKLF